MAESRFPFEQSRWHQGEPKAQWRWYEALEAVGTESVRARLAQSDAGSVGSIMGLGPENNITKGFAEEWLAWHERRKSDREAGFRRSQIFWTRLAAIAAWTAVLAGTVGWLVTIWRK